MKNMRLAHPKLIDVAVPANLRRGRPVALQLRRNVGDRSTRARRACVAGALTIVDGNSICPPELAAYLHAAVLIRPDGYVGFQAEKWNAEARSALDGFLNI
jgi:hypothetical protein